MQVNSGKLFRKLEIIWVKKVFYFEKKKMIIFKKFFLKVQNKRFLLIYEKKT